MLLIGAIVAVFGQMWHHRFINYDDDAYVTQNSQVRSGWTREGVVWAFTSRFHRHWHPLTWLSHMTDYALPFDPGEFDVVLFLETAEHVSKPERLVAELGRVTRRGGTMVLSTPNVLWEPVHALAAILNLHHSEGPHRFIRYRRLLSMVGEAGFRVVHAETNVLIPEGPEWLLRFGQWLEERLPAFVMHGFGLRRFLVCRKLS